MSIKSMRVVRLNEIKSETELITLMANYSFIFDEGLESKKEIKSSLYDNYFKFEEEEFNDIVYKLDELERDLRIICRKHDIIVDKIEAKKTKYSLNHLLKASLELINSYQIFQKKWKYTLKKLIKLTNYEAKIKS